MSDRRQKVSMTRQATRLATVLLFLFAIVAADDGCAIETDCRDCIAIDRAGCGWVATLGKCMDQESCDTYPGCLKWLHYYILSRWRPFGDQCETEHCFRMESCTDCLQADDCSWFYTEQECLPKVLCHPHQNCFLPEDAKSEAISDFCIDLDDPNCATQETCEACLNADGCGWTPRFETPPGCVPESVCAENCFTPYDHEGTSEEFCSSLEATMERDADICGSAGSCKECYGKQLTVFGTCKWFLNMVYEDSTTNYDDYCALECYDAHYHECGEIPSSCPCSPESSCEECLENQCGYWADDNERFVLDGRCHYFCRSEEYEWSRRDENCFVFDESFGLTAQELCQDHDACESDSSCKDCYSQYLPSDETSTCLWLHDSICAPRCDTTLPCDPQDDAFPSDCHCSSSITCEECFTDDCNWDVRGGQCTDECNEDEDCLTMDDVEGENIGDICIQLKDKYECQWFDDCQACFGHQLESDPDRTCVWFEGTNRDYCGYECDPDDGCNAYRPTCATVPFDVPALDYSDLDVHSPNDVGNCARDGPVFANYTSDPICNARGAECFVGGMEADDVLEFSFNAPTKLGGHLLVDITARLASNDSSRRVFATVDGVDGGHVWDSPGSGRGWDQWSDYVWEGVKVTGGLCHLQVRFMDGKVNVCSISVKPSFIVPFHAPALDYSDIDGFTSSNRGNCLPEGPVFAKHTSDSVCIFRGGDCFIGGIVPWERLKHDFYTSHYIVGDITARVASKRIDKEFLIKVGWQNSPWLNAPGRGWNDFEDIVWEDVRLRKGWHPLEITFVDGLMNLCSISVTNPAFIAPFDVGALDYTYLEGFTSSDRGNCLPEGPVFAKYTSDKECINRGGECYVGSTRRRDLFAYSFEAPRSGDYDITVRVASKNAAKRIRLEVDQEGTIVGVRTWNTPGNGWDKFEDRVFEGVSLERGKYVVDAQFLDGKVNLCSVSIAYS
jgi:hypothetical protein